MRWLHDESEKQSPAQRILLPKGTNGAIQIEKSHRDDPELGALWIAVASRRRMARHKKMTPPINPNRMSDLMHQAEQKHKYLRFPKTSLDPPNKEKQPLKVMARLCRLSIV